MTIFYSFTLNNQILLVYRKIRSVYNFLSTLKILEIILLTFDLRIMYNNICTVLGLFTQT